MWTSGRAVSLHVALAVFVPGCVALTWWQVSRALGGNTLSWVYTFEWPLFGAYAIYMWWKLVHDDAVPPLADGPSEHADTAGPADAAGATQEPGSARRGAAEAAGDPEDDGELAAYNRYLAELNASGRQKRW